MALHRLLASLVIIGVVALTAVAADAQSGPRSMAEAAKDWTRAFTAIEADLRSPDRSKRAQQAYADTLRAIIIEAAQLREITEAELLSQQRLLDALGPPPADGQPPETSEIAKQRKDLNAALADARARVAQTDLAATRAKALQEELSKAYRSDFRSRMLARSPSPLLPATLREGLAGIGAALNALALAPVHWYRALTPEQRDGFLYDWRTIGVFVVALAAWPVRRWLVRRLGPHQDSGHPTYARRLVAALAVAVADGLIPAVLLGAIYFRIKVDLKLNAGLAADIITQVCIGLIFLIMTAALSSAALAPRHPGWRLTPQTARAARRLDRTILFLAAAYALDRMVIGSAGSLNLSVATKATWALFSDSILAFGLLLLIRPGLWLTEAATAPAGETETAITPPASAEAATAVPSRIGQGLRIGVAVLALGSIAAIAAGYAALGNFIMQGLLNSAVVLAVIYVLKRLIEETIAVLSSAHLREGRLAFDGRERSNLRFWLGGAATLLFYGLAAYALLLVWGVPENDLNLWLGRAVSGFAIGGVNISLIDIGSAILVFAVGLIIAGRLRQTLDQRVLPRTNLDAGVRNSLATAAGYAGVVVAALIAIGVAGIDLSNIAIVAGALSVGIGFGMQNIVNNFVSGLILLAERPIKVGDWVVVGSQQGYVRKISVRATEIQTFDRSTVILPNSELLSQSVLNLTHKDKSGRVEIRIGVSYGSDVERVRKTLLDCAEAHAEVVSWPKPAVFFVDFGPSSLDFVLYAYLSDVEKRLTVSSELRFAIDKAFREAGIEIPYAQSDVHIRDLDRMIEALRSPAGAPPPSPEAAPPAASLLEPAAESAGAPPAAVPPAVAAADAAMSPRDSDLTRLLKRSVRPPLDGI
ncbi:MAG: DUF3772 domain-containing protein [Rhodospirillales bacterium]|jgi:small-conductance mechanosensitive channel|nr:DUF3772 domain-containing protein [Rhodospirillales bacterium]